VCGETFSHKKILSSLHGKWNRTQKCWVFPLDSKEKLLSYFNLTENDLHQQQKDTEPDTEPDVQPNLVSMNMFFDGASKGNPGPAGYGVQIISSLLEAPVLLSENIGQATNNKAEYSGVINGLKWVQSFVKDQDKFNPDQRLNLQIKGDSQLAIRQLNGTYVVKSPNIKVLYDIGISIISQLRKEGHNVTLKHIYREENSVADKLASDAAFKRS
jgi:ribonuclease HI